MGDEVFTKIAGNLLVNVRDLVRWGIDEGHTTEEKMRLNVTARREIVAKKKAEGKTVRQIAAEVGESKSTVQDDLSAIRTGVVRKPDKDKSTLTEAKEEASRATNTALTLVKSEPIVARYGTIVIDPPWEMEKIKRDVRPNQAGFDYPTMTEAELREFPVEEMAEEACHLFCWTTQKHLPSALRLIETWGFKYVLLMTWHKPGGFQPHGLPQYNSEFVVYGRRGAPKFRDTQAFSTCFQGDRREHSRKPDCFYDTVRRVTADGRIDVFSREIRNGFDAYGNEAGRFAANG